MIEIHLFSKALNNLSTKIKTIKQIRCDIRFALVYLVKFQRNTATCSELRR